ncbi:MAG: class I SAM-dependent methyltransferase [Acidimicrobiales bacterium]
MIRKKSGAVRTPADPEELWWFHSIDLGGGVVTAGMKTSEVLAREVEGLSLPDLAGKSVLDIGAWDGFFSFEAERRGAARVVALDHYAWSVDQVLQQRRTRERVERGERVPSWHEDPELWQPEALPGRAAFDLAHSRRGSQVEVVVGDFMTMDLEPLGTFDVVLFLGVLYHLQDPLPALRRVAKLTAGVAIIETVCMVVPGWEHHALWECFEGAELDRDPSNWWAPNATGLEAMARTAGFSAVELKGHPSPQDPPNPGYDLHYGRAVAHAFTGAVPRE